MDDLISRQDAIDIVVFECGKWTGLAKEISKQIKQLPFAQPDYTMQCNFCDMSICTLKDRPCSRKVVKENG